MQHVPFIILGQGLAGTSIAWWLHWRQIPFLIIDREPTHSSSLIAAGLVTPITGRKWIPSWRFDDFWPVAVEFYSRVEVTLNEVVFTRPGMIRFFADQPEIDNFAKRHALGQYAEKIASTSPAIDTTTFRAPFGAVEMQPGGKLDTQTYLERSREFFGNRYRRCDVDLNEDIVLTGGLISLPRLAVSTDRLIFCQGYEAHRNRWFSHVKFKPAKGEILTLDITGFEDARVFHRGVWLAKRPDGTFQAGATYDWKQLDQIPTVEGREEVLTKLREFFSPVVKVINQQAAIRPVHNNQYPVLGFHPEHRALVYFNGLGSKGTLQAPYFARHLLDVCAGDAVLDKDVDLSKKV